MAHNNKVRTIIEQQINNNAVGKITGTSLQTVLLTMVPNVKPEDTTSTQIQFVGDMSEEVETGYTKVLFEPNTNYYFTVSTGVTDVKFNTSIFTNDEAMESNVFFRTPTSAPTTISFPNGARYIGFLPTETGTQYILSIRNGIVVAAPIYVVDTTSNTENSES